MEDLSSFDNTQEILHEITYLKKFKDKESIVKEDIHKYNNKRNHTK